MATHYTSSRDLNRFGLWQRMVEKRRPVSFELELTARCNLNCRHCYINVPAGDRRALDSELTVEEIRRVADEAADLGVLWCLITGGEPLLREEFEEVYRLLKERGFLVSVFTNATLVTERLVRLFQRFPPRDLEVSVYGVSRETCERVTRVPGSSRLFHLGLGRLLEGGVPVRLKAMALRSNLEEMDAICAFGRRHCTEFRFDPFVHLRYDRDPVRNGEILEERLTAEEIVELERSDPERRQALSAFCARSASEVVMEKAPSGRLFHCGAGRADFCVGADGGFRLCSSLWHPGCMADLRTTPLAAAWDHLPPRVRSMESTKADYQERCGSCALRPLCMWCPALAHLETGELDRPVDCFCKVAQARTSLPENAPSARSR